MTSIGFFLDAGRVDGDIVEYLRGKFELKTVPDLGGSLFRVPPNDEDDEEFIVVRLGNSHLNCFRIEELIQKRKEQECIIHELRVENTQLKAKVAHCQSMRHEALQTVNKLRNEFVGLMEDITPRRDGSQTQRMFSSRKQLSARLLQKQSQSIPRLRLTSLTK